jgi:hypothetical protein
LSSQVNLLLESLVFSNADTSAKHRMRHMAPRLPASVRAAGAAAIAAGSTKAGAADAAQPVALGMEAV